MSYLCWPFVNSEVRAFLASEHTGVAQLVEQRSPKPQVAGSSPATRAMRQRLLGLWKDYSREWSEKVEWPTFPQLLSTTVAVLVGSLLLAIAIGLIDLVFSTLMRGVYSIF